MSTKDGKGNPEDLERQLFLNIGPSRSISPGNYLPGSGRGISPDNLSPINGLNKVRSTSPSLLQPAAPVPTLGSRSSQTQFMGTSLIQNQQYQSVQGETRIEYVPYEKKRIEYDAVIRTEFVPREVYDVDYYQIEHKIEYHPLVYQDRYVDYVPQERYQERVEYIPQVYQDKYIEYVPQERYEERVEYQAIERQVVHNEDQYATQTLPLQYPSAYNPGMFQQPKPYTQGFQQPYQRQRGQSVIPYIGGFPRGYNQVKSYNGVLPQGFTLQSQSYQQKNVIDPKLVLEGSRYKILQKNQDQEKQSNKKE